jgi:LysM repeat protein
VEERAGFTLDEALSNAIKLESINGVPLQSRIQQLCNQQGSTGSNSLVLSPYGSEVTPATVFDQAPEMVIKSPVTNSNASATTSGLADRTAAVQTHTIAKGETLYRLSKQYGVTVNQLKEWNKLKSNTIYKGHQLIVSDPAGAPATSGTVQQAGIASSNPGGSMPVPYGDDGQRLNVTAKGVSATAQEYHTVRTGETVASIAMKYGYTEGRFREMNGLQPNEYPKIGQRLKTNDCDCPEVPVSNANTLTPRAINPYDNTATSSATTNSPYQNTTTNSSPINNYSYPSPSSYGEGANNPNTRPFSSYSDIPVPATSTLTAPNNNYSNTGSTNQPANYSNYNNTNFRSVNSYDNTASRPSGMKRSHIVKDGEDLYDIARQYGTTVNILRQLNRMEANEVVIPNQKIFLE